MGKFVSSHPDWLTEVRLPAYAPDLNPAGRLGRRKNGLGNLAVRDVDQLAAIIKNRLKPSPAHDVAKWLILPNAIHINERRSGVPSSGEAV